jgi:uncharacterized protein (DUF1800 family)
MIISENFLKQCAITLMLIFSGLAFTADESFSPNLDRANGGEIPTPVAQPNSVFTDGLTFDIDGNGQYDALTDGLLILRGMFGLTGDALISGAIASDAVYTSSDVITARITRLGLLLDIDGNGQVDALTDGLVVLRYLFGLRGDALIAGVLADDATITTAAAISAKIESRVTPNSSPVAVIALDSKDFVAGNGASFTAKDSTDEEGHTLTYAWSLDRPDHSLAELDTTHSDVISFRPDAIGEYTLTLTVTDSYLGTASVEKTFTPVLPTPDQLPIFVATTPPIGVIDDNTDAVRFLTQATFGPTVESVEELLEKGGEAWFNEQISLPFSSWTEFRRTSWIEEIDQIDSNENGQDWLVELFSETAQNSPDQLRHRVTYALSQLLVISRDTDLGHRETVFTDYWDTLGRHAFGNFRDLLESVTFHPTMGHYLGMLGNIKADPENNIRPDENFAREVMQLFTIGLSELNQDGTLKLDANGDIIETYDQETITQYAAALTGWYYDLRGHDVHPSTFFSSSIHTFPVAWGIGIKPMLAYDEIHQKTEKNLLRGYFIPPGGSAEDAVQTVLDSLFNHPNLAPFFSMHLIRQLVTSNPTPGYVARVSAVFNNNGQGVRGDIGATIKAVLFDVEARNPNKAEIPLYGKVKEPLLSITHLNRLFDISLLSPETVSLDNPRGTNKWMRMAGEPSQRALYAESVFNFFRPDFAPVGEIAEMGLVAPELQITTEASIVNDVEMFRWLTTRDIWEWDIENGRDPDQFTLAWDFSELDRRWDNEGYEAVVDYLNLYMTGNNMGPHYKSELLALATDPNYWPAFDGVGPTWSDTFTDKMERHFFLQELLYVIITTPEFRVQK